MPPRLPFSTPLENIYATLAYFDLFDYPLTLEEIKKFLIGFPLLEDSLSEILSRDHKIEMKNNYYFLRGRSQILETRQEREKIAEKLWKKVKRFLPLVQMIPFLKMVAICNTLAFNNPTKDSDIDLFIITEKNRLFLARTLVTFLLHILGVRRHGQKTVGRFCLSFYVTEETLNLETIKLSQDIYLIYWIKTLQPLYGQEVYQKFLAENEWMKQYFPSIEQRPSPPYFKQNRYFLLCNKVQKWLLKGWLGDVMEKKLFDLQHKRHQRRLQTLDSKASVIVSKTMLKFHNIDRRKEFEERFEENLTQLRSSKKNYEK